MALSKKVKKSKSPVNPNAIRPAVIIGVADPLPRIDAPPVPATFVANGKSFRGLRPQAVQVALATKAAEELRAASGYAQQFGEYAPDKGLLADAFEFAGGWSEKLRAAKAWLEYVQHQEGSAWKHALAAANTLKVPFEFKRSHDASIATQYPSLTQVLAAESERSRRSAATKRKRKKEKAKAALGTAAKASGTPTTAPGAPSASLAKLLS